MWNSNQNPSTMTDNTTPLQQAIFNVRGLKDRDYSKEEIVTILQSLLPKEKEFVGEVFDAGRDFGEFVSEDIATRTTEYPNKQQFINQLYPD